MFFETTILLKILPNKGGVLCFWWFLVCFYSIEDVADSVQKNKMGGGWGVMEKTADSHYSFNRS